MKVIKLDFDGFWSINKEDNYFINLLRRRFDVEIDEVNPEYILYSCFDPNYFRKGVKIFFTGENFRIDFNRFDYGIGFDYLSFGDRYFRWPLYRMYGKSSPNIQDGSLFAALADKKYSKIDVTSIKNKNFCSMLVSNIHPSVDPMRELFFKELSKYKKVDSGGRALNNIGRGVENKIDFIKDYKFNIAFENSSTIGYTTEKIADAMLADTIPIYYGNPGVDKEFNVNSFVWLKSKEDIDVIIDKIIELDKDDEKYAEVLEQPWLHDRHHYDTEENLLDFFENIFKQDLKDVYRVNHHTCDPSYLDKNKIKKSLRKKEIRKFKRKIFGKNK